MKKKENSQPRNWGNNPKKKKSIKDPYVDFSHVSTEVGKNLDSDKPFTDFSHVPEEFR